MRILFIGGTRFVGRHLSESAVAAGHEVTVFHRGSTGKGAIEGADEVLGDRDGGLDVLRGRKFDTIVDTSGYFPRVVGDSGRAFADAADRYVFVSSLSAYSDDRTPGQDESGPSGPSTTRRSRRSPRRATGRSRSCASRRSKVPSRAAR